jgi:hypothetical protein
MICLLGFSAMLVACANFDVPTNTAAAAGAAAAQNRTVAAPTRERVILKERAPVRDSPHRSFGRELEEQSEDQEDGRRHRRDRDD